MKARKIHKCLQCGTDFIRTHRHQGWCPDCRSKDIAQPNDDNSEDFRTWFRTLSDEEQCERLDALRAMAAALGVTVPDKDAPVSNNSNTKVDSDADDVRQAECDHVAASLLEDVEI